MLDTSIYNEALRLHYENARAAYRHGDMAVHQQHLDRVQALCRYMGRHGLVLDHCPTGFCFSRKGCQPCFAHIHVEHAWKRPALPPGQVELVLQVDDEEPVSIDMLHVRQAKHCAHQWRRQMRRQKREYGWMVQTHFRTSGPNASRGGSF